MTEHAIVIDAPHFFAGIIFRDDGSIDGQKVTDAAPIVQYMKGWTYEKVRNYCTKRGWRIHIAGTVTK